MSPVDDLIPHRPPWRLVDRVLEVSPRRVLAEKRLSAGDPLLAAGELPESLLIEALAQAAACLRGALDGDGGGGGARLGYLVAATDFEFHGRALAGETLTLSAVEEASLGALHRFAGEATVDGRLVARGKMTFALGVE